jgi:hypothetical protein
MEKILSSLPFDRLYKAMTILRLILVILPLSCFISEKLNISKKVLDWTAEMILFLKKKKIPKDLLRTIKE